MVDNDRPVKERTWELQGYDDMMALGPEFNQQWRALMRRQWQEEIVDKDFEAARRTAREMAALHKEYNR